MKASRFSRWILTAFVLICAAMTVAAVPEVELLTDGHQLSPTSTLELRFSREMVKPEQLGVVVTPSPVTMEPALKGDFVWLSRRSGVFSPREEPKMGSTYSLRLRPDLVDAAGKAIGAGFATKLTTPDFSAVQGLEEGAADHETEPGAEKKIVFNREVKLEGAEGLFLFVRDDGETMRAKVRYATTRDYLRLDADSEPWEVRWQRAQGKLRATPMRANEDDDAAPETPRMSCLIVQPISLLTPGGVWRLEMKPGIESLSGGYKVEKPRSTSLGTVAPLRSKR